MSPIVLVAMETDVNYRGQQTIRNKEGKRINSAKWTLTPAKPPEQPDAQQNCKIVKATAATDERVLRCSRGKEREAHDRSTIYIKQLT